MLSIQSWQYYESCGFSPLQTQFPNCLFSRVLIQNDKLGEHFSPRASQMGSLVFSPCSPKGKCMLVIWGLSAAAKHPGSNRGVWCQGLLRVPLFVWVCQSVYPASELLYCSPDATDLPENGIFGSITFLPVSKWNKYYVAGRDRMQWNSERASDRRVAAEYMTWHVATILISFLYYDFKIHGKAITHKQTRWTISHNVRDSRNLLLQTKR